MKLAICFCTCSVAPCDQGIAFHSTYESMDNLFQGNAKGSKCLDEIAKQWLALPVFRVKEAGCNSFYQKGTLL
jgi:hypothetical protein